MTFENQIWALNVFIAPGVPLFIDVLNKQNQEYVCVLRFMFISESIYLITVFGDQIIDYEDNKRDFKEYLAETSYPVNWRDEAQAVRSFPKVTQSSLNPEPLLPLLSTSTASGSF